MRERNRPVSGGKILAVDDEHRIVVDREPVAKRLRQAHGPGVVEGSDKDHRSLGQFGKAGVGSELQPKCLMAFFYGASYADQRGHVCRPQATGVAKLVVNG